MSSSKNHMKLVIGDKIFSKLSGILAAKPLTPPWSFAKKIM
jgi:hypothetical protein